MVFGVSRAEKTDGAVYFSLGPNFWKKNFVPKLNFDLIFELR
jgi:hypothetical protein